MQSVPKHCAKCRNSYPKHQVFCPKDGGILSLKDFFGLVGLTIDDRYELEALIAVGTVSAVYSARRLGAGQRVAFKLLLPQVTAGNSALPESFVREASVAARLQHENIAAVLDYGQSANGITYAAIEWVNGKPLDDVLPLGKMPLKRAANVLRQIAAALEAAHARGVVHGALKPANIMLSKGADGRETVKVLDFGLARAAAEATGGMMSYVVCPPFYSSPEQFATDATLSPRSDIYALGVILYQLLTCCRPFDSFSSTNVIVQHLTETPTPIRQVRPDVPAEIEALINRMLAKAPFNRPAGAGEVAETFARALGLAVVAAPIQPAPVVFSAVALAGAGGD